MDSFKKKDKNGKVLDCMKLLDETRMLLCMYLDTNIIGKLQVKNWSLKIKKGNEITSLFYVHFWSVVLQEN